MVCNLMTIRTDFSLLNHTNLDRFCVLLIAVNIGIIAAIVDIGAIWLANIKTGICLPAFYLSREQCCVRFML